MNTVKNWLKEWLGITILKEEVACNYAILVERFYDHKARIARLQNRIDQLEKKQGWHV
jgi:uncharacterized protein YydD (DUF2326 family)